MEAQYGQSEIPKPKEEREEDSQKKKYHSEEELLEALQHQG